MIELWGVGIASGFALWLGGYLVGARRGIAARAQLRRAYDHEHARRLAAEAETTPSAAGGDARAELDAATVQALIAPVLAQGNAHTAGLMAEVQRLTAALAARDAAERAVSESAAAPAAHDAACVARVTRAVQGVIETDLLAAGGGSLRPGLVAVMDAAVATGVMRGAVISDPNGLLLAASTRATAPEEVASAWVHLDRLATQVEGSGQAPLATSTFIDVNGRHLSTCWLESSGWRCLVTVDSGDQPLPAGAMRPLTDGLNAVLGATLGRPFPPLPGRSPSART